MEVKAITRNVRMSAQKMRDQVLIGVLVLAAFAFTILSMR